MSKNYKLRYLPLFEEDLLEIAFYISLKLKNPDSNRCGRKSYLGQAVKSTVI